MDDYRIQWVGAPCGQHGPYIFYKGFKYFKDEKWKILSLGEFFFVRCSPEDPVCIGELQLLWEDKSNNGQLLSSLRLYFLPEDTPDGRSGSQGKDEVLAASDKVILKIEDLVDWTESGKDWNYGTVAIYEKDLKGDQPDHNAALLESFAINNGGLNVKDIKKEKKLIGDDPGNETKVIILSYPKYCRYITMMRRIQHVKDFWLRDALVTALGGFTVKNRNTRLVYCKEMFGHPTLSDNEKLCDHMAPNLKGRPRKKKTKIKHGKSPPEASSPASPDSSTNEAEITHTAPPVTPTHMKPGAKSKSERCYKDGVLVPNIKTRAQINGEDKEEVEFLSSLYQYMKERTTPIERIPHLGFKQIDLYYFYKLSQKWGGYERVCSRKLWKHIYDGLGGNPGSTSAATCTRRHYERLILPYERFLKGEDDRPLPSPVKHRKPHLIKKAEELTVKQQVKQERLLQLKQYEQTVEEKIMNAAQDYKVSPRVKSEVPKQNKENTTTPAVTQSVPVLLVQKVENVGVKPQVTFTKGVSSNEVKVKVEPTILVKKESHPVSTKSLSVNTQNVISVRVNKTLSIDAIPAVKMSSKCHSTVSTANIPPRAETLIRPALELRGIPSPIPSHLTPARVSPSILSPLVRKKTLSSPPVVTNIATPIKNTSLVATSRPSTPRSVTPKSRSGTPTQLRPVAPCKVQHTISQPVTAAGKEEAIRMRASVIQHTQHSQDSQIIKTESSAEDSVQDATNEIHAVQPSDLILRHISQDQMAINRAFYDSMIRPQPSTNSDSNGRKRSYENLVTPTHFPYYAYISPNSQGIPKLELSRIEDPYYDHTKRTKYPQDAKDSSKYYTKSFQNFSGDRKLKAHQVLHMVVLCK
uniref:AT-rich interactive domain-containing protein 5B-like n=1 Tax=Saccoglossus kowalevskii TaxID=10224 RepID=A0ABM0GNR0_SACKO|nr:PREDICTED: AT-rich interactive domain-containing protein 5B-like [Saccoglossus kowalevskii]